MDTKEMLAANVRNIAHELEAIADGNLYKDEEGEYVIIDDMDEWRERQYGKKREEFLTEHPEDFDRELYDTKDEWVEDEIGTPEDIDEPEAVSAYDYIDNRALSVENWKINRDGECVGGEIQFCWGGPNVWATEDGVFGAWGGDRFDYWSSEAGFAIQKYLEETMPYCH